jgi:YggT family protein
MRLVIALIDLYSLVVLAAVVISWVRADRRHPFVQLISNLTEPALAPIRRLIPPAGGVDFSPLVLLIALRLLRGVLVSQSFISAIAASVAM